LSFCVLTGIYPPVSFIPFPCIPNGIAFWRHGKGEKILKSQFATSGWMEYFIFETQLYLYMSKSIAIPDEVIVNKIYYIRAQKVMICIANLPAAGRDIYVLPATAPPNPLNKPSILCRNAMPEINTETYVSILFMEFCCVESTNIIMAIRTIKMGVR
jgi:hypothetical protein